MCDNHFDTQYCELHMQMIEIADLVTCPTFVMSSMIWVEVKENATVIPDPHEFEMVEPRYYGDVKNLMWYGNKTSIESLLNTGNFISFNGEHSLINFGEMNWYNLIPVGPTEELCVPYSKDNMLSGLARCDAVIIPQVKDWWGCVKSPNRLLEAVARGRFVLANSIPSYEPFKEWMWIGDIAEGLEWLKQQPGEEICNRIKKAQEYVKQHHSIEVVADQWERALTSVVENTIGTVT